MTGRERYPRLAAAVGGACPFEYWPHASGLDLGLAEEKLTNGVSPGVVLRFLGEFVGHGQAPRWRHNCIACMYLGTVTGPDVDSHIDGPMLLRHFDLWFCSSSSVSGGSLLARYGSEASEYISGPRRSGIGIPSAHPALSWARALHERRELTR